MVRAENFLLLCAFCFFSACQNHQDTQNKHYLFLSHIYQWGVPDNNRIDYRLKGFDFKKYDQIWMGGDICTRTSESPATLDYLDSIFDLSSPNTHWALGNHDLVEGHVSTITNKTGKNSFYASFFYGIGVVVLNTTEFYHPNYTPKKSECILLDSQLHLLQNIADTIEQASHLIVLHHNTILNNEMTDDSLNIGEIFNYYHPEYFVSCEQAATFDNVWIPLLQKIQNKGIQVISIGGDLGQRAKAFEYRSKDGIWFLGSGINNSVDPEYLPEYVTNISPDKLLIFKHDIKNNELSWEFVALNKLIDTN